MYLKDFVEKNYNFEKRNDDQSEMILNKIKSQITNEDVPHPSTSGNDEMTAEEILEIQQLDHDDPIIMEVDSD